MLSRLKSPSPTISFVCEPDDMGVIAEPRPAKQVLPAWFRKIAPIDVEHVGARDSGITIKSCMPFFDAMASGWILPLAATVRLEIKNGGSDVDTGWDFDRTMVSTHSPHQVTGHPKEPRPPFKFHNYWSIRTPPGWSCLFVPPLNRPNGIFEAVAGVVDTDTYSAHVHFPFFPIGPDGVHIIEKGTPIVQIIPFRRADVEIKGDVRAEKPGEADERAKIYRNTIASAGWYRKFSRADRN